MHSAAAMVQRSLSLRPTPSALKLFKKLDKLMRGNKVCLLTRGATHCACFAWWVDARTQACICISHAQASSLRPEP